MSRWNRMQEGLCNWPFVNKPEVFYNIFYIEPNFISRLISIDNFFLFRGFLNQPLRNEGGCFIL
jgi:hypothetical protein